MQGIVTYIGVVENGVIESVSHGVSGASASTLTGDQRNRSLPPPKKHGGRCYKETRLCFFVFVHPCSTFYEGMKATEYSWCQGCQLGACRVTMQGMHCMVFFFLVFVPGAKMPRYLLSMV